MLQLMREADAPDVGDGRTFRYSAGRATAAALLVLAAAAALLVAGHARRALPAYWIAAVLLVGVWISRGPIRARYRPTNWLVRLGDDGLYVKLRSYLNHHFPPDDAVVAFIPFRGVRRARMVRQTRRLPDSDRTGTHTRRQMVVELELKGDAPPELERALAAERAAKGPAEARWYGSSSGRYRHSPVRLSAPRVLEIEWGVLPGAAELMRALAVHCDVESAGDAPTVDYTKLAGASRAEQEARLRELAERGDTITAIRLARELYGHDMAEARRFVEGLYTSKSLSRDDS